MRRRWFDRGMMAVLCCWAGAAWPGPLSGRIELLELRLETSFLRTTNIPEEFYKFIPRTSQVGIYFPKGYSKDKTWPLFIALAPGLGNFIPAISNYQRFADELGFVVTAENIDPKSDEEAAPRYYYILATIDYLKKRGILGDNPIWIGGASGGAKWAMHLGAYGGAIFSAVLAIACNDDFATYGYKELPNRSALDLPIYLLNGNSDPIAGPRDTYYKEMLISLRRTGFVHVTVALFDGGHEIPFTETKQAFERFIKDARINVER